MFFATILDKNYITRAQVMFNSLIESTNNDFGKLFIFCLDDNVFEYFKNTEKIQVIKTSDLEEYFPELLNAKSNRSFIEYIFTLSPFLPIFILNNHQYVKRITTIDADLYFISTPAKILNLLNNDEIGITPHSFPEELIHMEKHGKYNVSFQSFPRTENAIACLNYWAKLCIEFCGDEIDEYGRYADQKYLDNWKSMFSNVIDFPFPQIGLAPWNLKKVNNNIIINRKKNIVFYHFHDFKIRSNFHSTIGLVNYNFKEINNTILQLYTTYWNKLCYVGHKTDNTFKRHSDNIFKYLFLRDIKNKPILIKIFNISFYLDLRKYLNPLHKIIKRIYV